MRPFVLLISTLSLFSLAPIATAQPAPHGAFVAAHESESLWNYDRGRSIDLADSGRSTPVHISQSSPDPDRATIAQYSHAIDTLDRANETATPATVTVNNAQKAALYNRRGLLKLQVGDKRGAIDDLMLASELFDEVGLNDISSRALQIARSLEN
jgi:hypothetical protein